jgi:hypothetical protein
MIGKLIQRMLEIGQPSRSGRLLASYTTFAYFWDSWIDILSFRSWLILSFRLWVPWWLLVFQKLPSNMGLRIRPLLPWLSAHSFCLMHLVSVSVALLDYCNTKQLFLVTQPLILAPLSEMYGRTWVLLAYIVAFNNICLWLLTSVQVLHVGNLVTLALSLGSAFAPNTGTLIGLRFLCEHSGSIFSLFFLWKFNWLQPDFQQVRPSHAVEVLSEICLPHTNEHLLCRCTLLDHFLVRTACWSLRTVRP